ncbi:hypothetical protein ACET3Z_004945 [Daucus carota]
MTGDASQSHVAKLVVGSLSNIIATGKIDEVPAVEGHEQTIHGVRLGGDNQVIDGRSAKIPFPVGDEIMTVHQDNDTVKFVSTPKVRRFDDDDVWFVVDELRLDVGCLVSGLVLGRIVSITARSVFLF